MIEKNDLVRHVMLHLDLIFFNQKLKALWGEPSRAMFIEFIKQKYEDKLSSPIH